MRRIAARGFDDYRPAECSEEFRHIIGVRSNAHLGFHRAGKYFHQEFVALFHQFAPRLRDGGASLRAAVAAAVFFPGRLQCFSRFDPGTVKVAMEGFARLGRRALEEIELVNAAVLVAALFCW